MMKKILLSSEDVPSKMQLQHAVSRLTKCYDLLKKYKGRSDFEDPKALIATAAFLDMLVRREARNLEKGESTCTDYDMFLKQRFTTYLKSLTHNEADLILEAIKKELADALVG
jgi:hypothetical protein